MEKNQRKILELKTCSSIRGKKTQTLHAYKRINIAGRHNCKYKCTKLYNLKILKKLTEGWNRQKHNHNHNCRFTHSSGNYRTWQNVNNNTDYMNGSIFYLHFLALIWHNNCRFNILLKFIQNCMEVEHMLGYQKVSLKNHVLKPYRIIS